MNMESRASTCLGGVALLFLAGLVSAAERGTIEEIVVTAQKRSESIQEVPIAVSAFDAGALEAHQIDTFSDLQFNVPNVSYSKTNFTGNNFQIRGIGTLLVATSADSGVGMHVNDVYLNSPRIFETEYYDMAQVEILRGPQGTLFGRNATGGVVNMKTARPDFEALSFDLDAQLGNFDHRKIKGAVNIPITDSIAGRIAGIWMDREGYTENLLTGNDVDGRDQWSVRGSLRFEIGDNTRLDLIAHRFEEDSNRSRSQKQLCHWDASAVLGCIPDGLPTEPINAMTTAGNLLSSTLLLGPLGIFNFFEDNTNPATNNPSDMRKVRLQFEPEYEAEEDFIMAELEHAFDNGLTFTAIGAYQETSVLSRQDYNGTAPDTGAAALPAGFCSFSPAACTYFGMSEGGPVFVSSVPNQNTSLGAIGGPGEFHLTSRGLRWIYRTWKPTRPALKSGSHPILGAISTFWLPPIFWSSRAQPTISCRHPAWTTLPSYWQTLLSPAIPTSSCPWHRDTSTTKQKYLNSTPWVCSEKSIIRCLVLLHLSGPFLKI